MQGAFLVGGDMLMGEKEIVTKVSFDTEPLDKAQEKADKLKATLLEVKELIREIGKTVD